MTNDFSRKLDNLWELLFAFGEQISKLEELGDRYFLTLHQGARGVRFNHLLDLFRGVKQALEIAEDREKRGDAGGMTLLMLLEGTPVEIPQELKEELPLVPEMLRQWRVIGEEYIQILGVEVDKASKSLKKTGIQAGRQRKATSLSLKEAGVKIRSKF